MTEREAIEAILLQWSTSWTAEQPDVPWTTRNEEFSTDGLTAFARVSVQHTTAEQTTCGSAPSRRFERRGNVFVQLFAPVDAGQGTLADYAESVRVTLEGKRLGDLNLYAARTEEQPADGAWASVVVVVAFRYTQTR